MAKSLDLAAAGSGILCPLTYPERYEASSRFAALAAEDGATLSQETQLMLYALKQQIVEGPASASSKASGWGWSVVENAKYSAWKQLGSMSAMEAMRLYVRTVEEEHPNWYTALVAHESGNPQSSSAGGATDATAANLTTTPAAAAGEPGAPAPLATVCSYAVEGAWTPVTTQTTSGKRPCPRYEHGAAIMDGFLYVVGGNYAGRYLGDVWRLDLSNSTWSQVSTAPPTPSGTHTEANGNGAAPEVEAKAPAPVLGPLAGHTVAQWGDNLLLIGGHVKAKTAADAGALSVRVLDPSSGTIKVLEPAGTAPCARGGHSATRIGDQLWVFGGEDATRKPLDDLHCLDMGGMVWSQPLVKRTDGSAASKAWPGPRSAHSAAAFLDRYIVIFGGGSAATCFSDLFVLDTKAEGGPAWIKMIQRAKGQKVTPRAGHSAVVCGDVMYIVGGGNNVKGCTDVLGLDLSGLSTLSPDQPCTLTWHTLTSTPARDPLSSEGISLLVLPQQHQPPVLVAFGGYNGKYHNTVSVMLPPKLPATEGALESGVEGEGTQLEGKPSQRASASGPEENGEPTPAVAVPPPPPLTEVELLRQQVAELQAALAAAREEAETAVRGAAAAAAADTHELALLRKQLATTQSALDTASKGLEDARAALGRESSKVMRLEVEGAELLKMLNAAGEERKELEALRRQVKEAESKKGGSIWGYIAGGTPA